jgi:hypothetical protein
MTTPRALRRLPAADPRRGERGISILLAMLVLFVLVVVIFQVKFDATVELDQARATVANARMQKVADAAFLQARSALLMDIEQAQGGGDEGAGGDATNPLEGEPPAEGEGGEESADGGADISDVIARTDSLLDDWQDSVALQPPLGNDYTLWVEVVDEDSKLNLLGLWSPDEEQKTAVHEMVRNLLDKAFDGTSLDLSWTDATEILDSLDKWVKGDRGSFDPVPKPKLKKTNAEEQGAEDGTLDPSLLDDTEKNYPLTLDELLNIEGLLPEHLSGFVEDDVFHPGLEEYLTLWSQLELKPKPPEVDPFTGSPFTKGSLFDQNKIDNTAPGSEDESGEDEETGDEPSDQPKPTNDGLVNINTAPLAVLRAIAPEDVPTTFLEHIVEFRNRIIELRESGKLNMADAAFGNEPTSVSGGMEEEPEEGEEEEGSLFGDEDDDDPTKYVFEKPEDVIPKVEEEFGIELHAEIDVETEFVTRLAVNSQVFTVKVLVLDEQTGRRTSYRGVLWRMEGAEAPVMVSLVQLEPFYDSRRLKDFPADIAEKSKERFERWTDEGYVAPH